MKVLETERLVLRPFESSDLDDFYEYAKNPNVGPTLAGHLMKTKKPRQRF